MKATFAIAALVATTLAAGAIAAFAQEAGSTTPAAMNHGQMNSGQRPMQGMMMDGNGPIGPRLLMLSCSSRGAEELDVVFTRLSHRIPDLTADQTKLLDALREKALTDQTKFADACRAAMPGRNGAGRPDLLTRMKAGISIEEARLAALKDVLPAFEAFYNSLSDAQKAALAPHRPDGRLIDHGAKGRMLDGPMDDQNTDDSSSGANG